MRLAKYKIDLERKQSINGKRIIKLKIVNNHVDKDFV